MERRLGNRRVHAGQKKESRGQKRVCPLAPFPSAHLVPLRVDILQLDVAVDAVSDDAGAALAANSLKKWGEGTLKTLDEEGN